MFEGHGSNLRADANPFKEDMATAKSVNLVILFRTHLDIPVRHIGTVSGPVHTNGFLFDRISRRLGLPSTKNAKTHRFENALESRTKRKRVHIVLMWTVENASN